jgi:hypothetical protein
MTNLKRINKIEKDMEEIKTAFEKNNLLFTVNEYSDMIYQRGQDIKKLQREDELFIGTTKALNEISILGPT